MAQQAASATGGEMRRTLSLTGVTINAMALIAPGAFLWTTIQEQAALTNLGGGTTAADMWTGLAAALILAFLTAISYSELSDIYPEAGAGSSYYFAEAAFLERDRHKHFARVAKFTFGWISHLYYWIYPGIMVAFSATLVAYLISLSGVDTSHWTWQLMLLAAAFAGLTGYIAFRGITGSTLTAIVINVIQLTALVIFSVLAIVYRLTHPAVHYAQSTAFAVMLPHNVMNLLFQSTVAILLLVGFESITALGAESKDPKRDIRRGVLLSLVIQGLIAYMFEYFAANYFIGDQLKGVAADGKTVITGYDAVAASSAPMGDMMHIIGNQMLGGTGTPLTIILALTVILALIGTTLACLNTGVRISYVMGRDRELPSVLGMLHGEYATPHWGIWILVVISAVFGAYGVLNVDNLTRITLASNIGTFLVYGLTNLIALIAFWGRPSATMVKHTVVPVLGLAANILMLLAVLYLGIHGGGSSATDAKVAIGIVAVWLVAGVIWLVGRSASSQQPILVRSQ
jgi:basic amino acid/polyamine antiporter, APA family